MSIELKICGLASEEAIDAALHAGADWVGLVHFPASPRHVAPARAQALAERARGRAGIVLLTVDAEASLLDDLVAAIRPDLLQLHGRESPQAVAAIQARTGLPAMKALGVSHAGDLAAIGAYAAQARRILLDAKPPRDARHPGGNGLAFDWALLAGLEAGAPFMLSGGINADNVARAIEIARPAGLDVSSGVERAPGEKDPAAIAAFARAARDGESALAAREHAGAP